MLFQPNLTDDEPPEPVADGEWSSRRLAMPGVHSEITATVWTPAGAGDRVLVAHDGPDYDRFGRLGRFLAASIAAGEAARFLRGEGLRHPANAAARALTEGAPS